ncbi:MAG: helix-turn-helix transcriptional regulator [Phyllobacterium sp.]|uniref:helix-turn-helix transcriptional regulator n=1 Tax=Phyllobacterium sp. TaxID=1871046 RepID=UPI0030F1F430
MTETIGIEEVATAVGVGVRCLQTSFRRVHCGSPREFLTRMRLERARQLLSVSGQQATVTAVATRLGFFELGRFSQLYSRHFGESPSATLGRLGSGSDH